MVNWCTTAYVIEGDTEELESLYEAMTEVKMGKNPNVEDPFGTVVSVCLFILHSDGRQNILTNTSIAWYSAMPSLS